MNAQNIFILELKVNYFLVNYELFPSTDIRLSRYTFPILYYVRNYVQSLYAHLLSMPAVPNILFIILLCTENFQSKAHFFKSFTSHQYLVGIFWTINFHVYNSSATQTYIYLKKFPSCTRKKKEDC